MAMRRAAAGPLTMLLSLAACYTGVTASLVVASASAAPAGARAAAASGRGLAPDVHRVGNKLLDRRSAGLVQLAWNVFVRAEPCEVQKSRGDTVNKQGL